MRIVAAIVAAQFGTVFGFFVGLAGCVVLGYLGYFVFHMGDPGMLSYVAICLPVVAAIGGAWFCARAVLKDSQPPENELPSREIRESPDWLKHKMSTCRPDE